jgi:hypothetical protein
MDYGRALDFEALRLFQRWGLSLAFQAPGIYTMIFIAPIVVHRPIEEIRIDGYRTIAKPLTLLT